MENKQHVQLPNGMAGSDLEPKDQLIYLTIKRHANINPDKCFPSLATIAKESGACINTVRKSITKLVDKGYLIVEKFGKSQRYKFSEYKWFEPFSYEFLDKQDISFTAKSYLCAAQQYMYTDLEGLGKVSFTNAQLSSKINMPESTISKCNRELMRQNYLTVLKSNLIDPTTGCKEEVKVFQLNTLGQAIIWGLCDHEDRIKQTETKSEENSQRITELEHQIESQNKLITQLLNTLKKEEPSYNTEYEM